MFDGSSTFGAMSFKSLSPTEVVQVASCPLDPSRVDDARALRRIHNAVLSVESYLNPPQNMRPWLLFRSTAQARSILLRLRLGSRLGQEQRNRASRRSVRSSTSIDTVQRATCLAALVEAQPRIENDSRSIRVDSPHRSALRRRLRTRTAARCDPTPCRHRGALLQVIERYTTGADPWRFTTSNNIVS